MAVFRNVGSRGEGAHAGRNGLRVFTFIHFTFMPKVLMIAQLRASQRQHAQHSNLWAKVCAPLLLRHSSFSLSLCSYLNGNALNLSICERQNLHVYHGDAFLRDDCPSHSELITIVVIASWRDCIGKMMQAKNYYGFFCICIKVRMLGVLGIALSLSPLSRFHSSSRNCTATNNMKAHRSLPPSCLVILHFPRGY